MRRAIVLLLACSLGCAYGGANEEGGPVKPKNDGGLPDDFIEDPPPEDGGAEATEDAEEDAPDDVAVEDSTVEPDVAGDAIFPPEDTGCTPKCTTCGADDGCGGTCKTGACPSGESCASGKCVAPTRSFLSPGDYAFAGAWARGITWTIGSEAPATIFYTLDGSTPGPTSASKPAPADIFVATNGAVLRWYADNGAKSGTQSMTVNIDPAGKSTYGFIVEKTNLSSKGPVVVVSPGATIAGSAGYQAWNSTSCPGCRMQLVYGIGAASAGCLYDWSPGAHPGATGTGTISVKAPSAPGTYKLNVSYTLQTSCANGMATNPLGVRPTASIATIVVK